MEWWFQNYFHCLQKRIRGNRKANMPQISSLLIITQPRPIWIQANDSEDDMADFLTPLRDQVAKCFGLRILRAVCGDVPSRQRYFLQPVRPHGCRSVTLHSCSSGFSWGPKYCIIFWCILRTIRLLDVERDGFDGDKQLLDTWIQILRHRLWPQPYLRRQGWARKHIWEKEGGTGCKRHHQIVPKVLAGQSRC